jgi:predicted ATPase/class 3 adenylate cyclase/Tfp pilus assembly protein PilF
VAVLPSGTVTFLFTDIEGSTTKWQNWPHRMKSALQRHDAILQEAISKSGGWVFKTVGDAFCAAFPTAFEAVQASLAIEQGIGREDWDLPVPLKVRIAVHTGEAVERNGDYYGPALNRVARLEAITYGGQVLMSLVTAELIRDMLPEPFSLRCLGDHRLKDLTRPEEVYQLLHPDLPAEFPPPKSLDYHPHNLAILPTAFIGREAELKNLQNLLEKKVNSVITITGPGGMGKTRIALQTGAEVIDKFAHGVFFLDLTPVQTREAFFGKFFQVLRIPPAGETPAEGVLQEYLKDKKILLILDNFEHIMEMAAPAARLLTRCPGLKYLVTSREPLHIRGEQVFHLPPLGVPDPHKRTASRLSRISQFDAVKLFIERALAVNEHFQITRDNAPAVAQICCALDGIPLAIELAAARTTVLPPEEILRRLGNRLNILTCGAVDLPQRHRNLRATICWSYDLLDQPEKNLFLALGLFRGPFPLEAAEKAFGGDGFMVLDVLEKLLEKSLLTRKEGASGRMKFTMLETIREFSQEQLRESPDREAWEGCYGGYLYSLALESREALNKEKQAEWMDLLVDFSEDLNACLSLFHDQGEQEKAIQMAAALQPFYEISGLWNEGLEWYGRLRDGEGGVTLMIPAASLLLQAGRFAEAEGLLEQVTAEKDWGLKYYYTGWAAFRQGRLEEAEENFIRAEEFLVSEDPRRDEARLLTARAMVRWKKAARPEAEHLLARASLLSSQTGDIRLRGQILNNRGILAYQAGRFAEAADCLKEALPLFESIRDTGETLKIINNLGHLHLSTGDPGEALKFYRDLAARSSRSPFLRGTAYLGMADAHAALGSFDAAGDDCGRAEEIITADGYPGDYGILLRIRGDVQRGLQKHEEARRLYREALPFLEENGEEEDREKTRKALEEIENGK